MGVSELQERRARLFVCSSSPHSCSCTLFDKRHGKEHVSIWKRTGESSLFSSSS